MSTANKILRYTFESITTDQFAIFPETYDPSQAFSVTSNFNFNFANNLPFIKLIGEFIFLQKEKIFIKLSTSVEFNIHIDDWKYVAQEESMKFVLERPHAIHFASLLLGISRGILHAKAENSPLAGIILPGRVLSEHIKEDIELPMQPEIHAE